MDIDNPFLPILKMGGKFFNINRLRRRWAEVKSMSPNLAHKAPTRCGYRLGSKDQGRD